MTLYSKKAHINPLTGYAVSDETMTFFGHNIREDDMNYYVSPAWSTDNMTEKVYPKSDWKCLD